MDDFMLVEYLKRKGMNNMGESEFMERFRDYPESKRFRDYEYEEKLHRNGMSEYPYTNRRRHSNSEYFMEMSDSDRNNKYDFSEEYNRMSDMDKYKFMEAMRMSKKSGNEHFTEPYAKFVVSQMYHMENGRKHMGEKFDMLKAKEVCERYKGVLPIYVTHADVYVAINSQYHDYCELFKSWFGDNIDHKIIEAAIIFWFKDIDYTDGFKIWKYFEEK